MKKLFSVLLTAAAAVCSAQEPLAPLPPIPIETPKPKEGFFYVRFTAAEKDLVRPDSLLPGLGLGYRRLAGNGAADISFSGIGRGEKHKGVASWTAPKASYIHYLQPDQEKTAYLGAGLAWGGVDEKDLDKQISRHFIGIIPSATVGYEFLHKTSVLGFAELNISQPAVSVYKKGSFPGPIAEASVGVGF